MTRFAMILLAATSSCALYAQRGGPVTLIGDLQGSYNGIKNNLTKAAEAMPDSGYNFKPTEQERNFGGWVAHVADAQMRTCAGITGSGATSSAGTLTSKADLVAALQKSFDECDKAYGETTEANASQGVRTFRGEVPRVAALFDNIAHDQECYGSMAVYLRLQMVVPPSSAGRGMGRGRKGGNKK